MSEDELIVEVNSADQDIGVARRGDLHSDSSRFHRSIAVVIFTTSGKIVLQQRSLSKKSDPGLWTITGGHQKAGQSVLETAQRECQEELGISPDLRFGGKTIYRQKDQSEIIHIYWGIHDGPYTPDPEEVEKVDVFEIKKFLSGGYPQIGNPHPVDVEIINTLSSVWKPLLK